MKAAIIGSRSLSVDISQFIPKDVSLIVSGGAKGIDQLAYNWALKTGTPILTIAPSYSKFGRRAPLIRNKEIVNNVDLVIAIWDGHSRGTKFTIDYAKEIGKPIELHIVSA